jgi:hypothetical protein
MLKRQLDGNEQSASPSRTMKRLLHDKLLDFFKKERGHPPRYADVDQRAPRKSARRRLGSTTI